MVAANTNAAAFPVLVVVFVPSHVLFSLQLIGIEGAQRDWPTTACAARRHHARLDIPSAAFLASIHSGLPSPRGQRLNLET